MTSKPEAGAVRAIDALKKWESETGGAASPAEGNAYMDGFNDGMTHCGKLADALQAIVKVLDKNSEEVDNVTYFNGRYCGELHDPLSQAQAVLKKVGK